MHIRSDRPGCRGALGNSARHGARCWSPVDNQNPNRPAAHDPRRHRRHRRRVACAIAARRPPFSFGGERWYTGPVRSFGRRGSKRRRAGKAHGLARPPARPQKRASGPRRDPGPGRDGGRAERASARGNRLVGEDPSRAVLAGERLLPLLCASFRRFRLMPLVAAYCRLLPLVAA